MKAQYRRQALWYMTTGFTKRFLLYAGAGMEDYRMQGCGMEKHGMQGCGMEKHGMQDCGMEKQGMQGCGMEKHGMQGCGMEKQGMQGCGMEKQGMQGCGMEKHRVEDCGMDKQGMQGCGMEKQGMQDCGMEKQGMQGCGMEKQGMQGCGMEKHGVEDCGMDKHETDRHGRRGKRRSRVKRCQIKRCQIKKCRVKKRLPVLLAAAFLAMCLAACGNRPGEAGKGAGASVEAEKRAFGIDLMQELGLQNSAQVVCGKDSAWAITTWKDAPVYQYEYEPENGAAGIKEIEWQQGENETLLGVLEQDGRLYAKVQNRADDSIEIRRHGGGGQWDTVMTIAEKDMEWEWYTVGGGFFLDSSGNAYLVSGDTVTRFDEEGKRSRDYDLDGNACFFLEDSEKGVECVAARRDRITLYELREDRAEKKWTLDVPASQAYGVQSSDGGTLCLATEEELLFLDRESGSLLGRASLVTTGVPSVMAGVYDADAGELRVYGMEGGMYGNLFCGLLSPRDPSAEQRTEITYGTWGATPAVKAAIMRFNQENEDYYVTIRDYYGDLGNQRLHAEMAGGTAPDIIDMKRTAYYQSYVRNGYLEDLAPWLEQSQYGDDILWNVLEPYRVDGGLYLLMPQFEVDGLIIHPEYAGSVEEWNMDTFLGLLERDRWDKEPFSFSCGSPPALLQTLLAGRQEEFIDREGKKASFQDAEFTELLALCREYGEQDWPDRNGRSWEENALDTLCYETYLAFFLASDYMGEVAVYGREYPIYGYPASSGQIYKINSTADCCAVYAGSGHKEGAWEFLESLLGEEYQGYSGIKMNAGLPLRRSLFEKKEEEAKETAVRVGGDELWITDSELRIIEDIIYNGEFTCEQLDINIWNVVQEETAYYFAGDKSAEEVAEIIQNRVQLILNE